MMNPYNRDKLIKKYWNQDAKRKNSWANEKPDITDKLKKHIARQIDPENPRNIAFQ